MPAEHDLLSTRDIRGMYWYELKLQKAMVLAEAIAGPILTSDQAQEKYPWLGMPPPMRVKKSENHHKGLSEQSVTVVNVDYEASMKWDPKFQRRDKSGQLRVRLGQLAERDAAHWYSLVIAKVLAGSANTGYDGQYFYDDDHSEGDSGTQKNLLTASEVAELDVGTATEPTQHEMSRAIMGVIAWMMSIKDDQGEPLNELASKFKVIVPFNLYAAAQAAVTKDLLNAGSGAVAAGAIPNDIEVTVGMSARLTSTASAIFYVFITDGRTASMIRQEETSSRRFATLGIGSEYEIEHGECLSKIEASRGLGYGHWQRTAKATLE